MGKIFYIIGKSSTGKDTIYHRILEDEQFCLRPIIRYTTRPIRDGEVDGVSYHFETIEEYNEIRKSGRVIEENTYNTVHGPWHYFTVDDGSIDLSKGSYITTGVLSSYVMTRDYYGKDIVLPIYIEIEDGVRLQRALDREKQPENHKYVEMCRRFLADNEDFSEEKIKEAGIERRFYNIDLENCIEEVKEYIRCNL